MKKPITDNKSAKSNQRKPVRNSIGTPSPQGVWQAVNRATEEIVAESYDPSAALRLARQLGVRSPRIQFTPSDTTAVRVGV